jgi:hypothetical protein
LIEDNKKEVGKVISDQSKNLLKNLLNKSGNAKQVIFDAKNQLSNIINKNRHNSTESYEYLEYREINAEVKV